MLVQREWGVVVDAEEKSFMPRMILSVALAVVAGLIQAEASAQAPASDAIRLHPQNPHYFLFRGNAVVLITNGEHYGAVMNPDFDYKKYLDTLQKDGLNYTRIFGGSYLEVPEKSFGILRNDLAPARGRFLAPWVRSSQEGYAGGGNKFALNTWNMAYFERFRDFLTEASKRGIVVEVTLFSSQYGEEQWKLSPFNPGNNVNGTTAIDWKKTHTLDNGNILSWQEKYARNLVAEANGFDNVIFEIQNEPWSDRPVLRSVQNPYLFPPNRDKFPNSIDIADPESMAWQKRVAEWITSEEGKFPNKHLIAQNYCNFGLPVEELVPGVSMVNFHYAFPGAALWNYGLDKAIAYDETGFLGTSDDAYRRQAWNYMLSGGSAFDGLDYSFSVGYEDGSDPAPNGPGGGSTALRKQLGILSKFLKKFPLIEMKPDADAVKSAGGAYPRVLSNGRGQYGIYLDGSGGGDIVLRLPAGDYAGEWVNVVTGESAKVERMVHKGGESRVTAPKFEGGIALRLERSKK
jgi:hypothetical protein